MMAKHHGVVRPISTQLMKTSLPQQWANRINDHGQKAVESILAMGRDLIAAKKQLGHGGWQQMFAGHPQVVAKPLRFSVKTAQRLMAIAQHAVLSKGAHVHLLPPAWGTLYELTKVPIPILERAITAGKITPEMQRRDVRQLRPSPRRARPAPHHPLEILSQVPLTEDDLVAAIYDKGCELCRTLDPNDISAFVGRVRAAMTAIEEKYLGSKGTPS
jgi:hypothetical protein